jgi:DNA segregation ATPase FtsK/SpoIIIE, S-DNA-T family
VGLKKLLSEGYDMSEKYEFSRQPRFLPEMPSGEIEIINPPNLYEKPEISWFSLFIPPAVMLVITVLIAMTSQSMFMLISIATTILTLFGSLMGVSSQIKKYKKKKKEREKKYLQYIADSRSELALAHQKQISAMNETNPAPDICLQRISQIDNKLWERTSSYTDFLSLRIGVGSVPSTMKIKYTKQAIVMESDPLIMEPQNIALEYNKIPNMPVTVNLVSSEICGIAGEESKTMELAEILMLQMITHHGYDDIRIVILTSENQFDRWNWLKHLPHIWNDSFSSRYILCGKAMSHTVLGELNSIIKVRDLKSNEGINLPHYVFIVDDVSLLENEPINKYLYNKSAKLGVSTIFIAQNQAYLPMNCTAIITFSGKSGEFANRSTGEKIIFTPDKIDVNNYEQASRKLAPLRISDSTADFSLPKSISLMGIFRAKTTSDVDVIGRWNKNKTYKGMSVPIGAKAGSSLFNLDLHETGHGPHGLVAGTTGSGKSELLQSIIISLAINYHPHDLVFVLIDYKGGGMADVFKGMPHLVGTITNLGGNQTTRALLSIKSELMSRQRIFSEYGVNNIDKYQKLYYSRKDAAMPPIPHLIMIADEFAELKQDQPDFMKELVSTARVGRSLGVHLILATQKPAGVVDDQIWSNSKFKICLKVQDEADSKDVIKKPDAAMIKEPGRAYIQVGNDEIFELFQSAFSGADYDPDGEMQKTENRKKRIYKIALNGRAEQIFPLEEDKTPKNELPTQLKALVDYIIMASKKNSIEALSGPWLPPLPEILYMNDVFNQNPIDMQKHITWQNKDILKAPIGIVDDPRSQKQLPLDIDFASEGNLFIYGSPGTGKTYLIKTLCMSLAYCYSSAQVNIYIMDFGGTSLKVFESLPHCGGVITIEQESLIDQFVIFIFRTIDERKKLFEDSGREGFNDYRLKGGNLPAIIIIIDNYFALSETYPDIDDRMIVLAREGNKYGIFMVVSATNSSMIRYKLAVNFKMAISLQLTEKSEYSGIVGRTEGLEPSPVLGRGLLRGNPPLEFQTSLPEFENIQMDKLIDDFITVSKQKKIDPAIQIPVMPSYINIEDLNKHTDKLAIGLSDNDLQPVYLDFVATPIVMVTGDAMSGKSTLLVTWIKMLNIKEGEQNLIVYALDSNSMGICELIGLPNVIDVSAVQDINPLIDSIKEILDERRKQLVEVRRIKGDTEKLIKAWKQIVFVIDKLSELTNSDKYSLKELIERIIKQERVLKIAILASDNTSDLQGNWDSLGKAIKEEQTGVLLGSIKEQSLFNCKVPYGKQEKEILMGDGYLIVKNKFIGIRCGVLKEKGV